MDGLRVIAWLALACASTSWAQVEEVRIELSRGARLDPYRGSGYASEPYRYYGVEDATAGAAGEARGGDEVLAIGPDAPALISFAGLHRALYRGASITGVELILTPLEPLAPQSRLEVRRILRDWRELEVDGARRRSAPSYAACLWAAPRAGADGVDRAAEPSFARPIAAQIATDSGKLVLDARDLGEDLRRWYADRHSNHGWLLSADRALTFHSSEAADPAQRPRLVIHYKRPARDPDPREMLDLGVTFIERLPRFTAFKDYGSGQYVYRDFRGESVGVMKHPAHADEPKGPTAGEPVRFIAHIRNHGGKVFAGEIPWVWTLNDEILARGVCPSVRLGRHEGRAFELEWKWRVEASDHRGLKLAFAISPPDADAVAHNNRLEKYVHARTVQCWVEEELYRYVSSLRGAWGGYSFEDYLQWHFHIWNETYLDKSRFPGLAPDGVRERVTLDRIVIVPTGALDRWGRHLPKKSFDGPDGEDRVDPHFDGEWGWVWPKPSSEELQREISDTRRFLRDHTVVLETSLLHELTHQTLGAFDIYWSNMEPSLPHEPRGKVKLKGEADRYITRGDMFAFAGLMGGGDTRTDPHQREGTGLYCAHSVMGFNSNLPYRNGFFGEWQYDLPERCFVRIVDGTGAPLAGARVDIWQAVKNAITAENQVASDLRTDEQGRLQLPDQDSGEEADFTTLTAHTLRKHNPWGRINVVGTNTTLLLRVRKHGLEDWVFARILPFNIAALNGQREEGTITRRVALPAEEIRRLEVARATLISPGRKRSFPHLCDGRTLSRVPLFHMRVGDALVLELARPARVGLVRILQSDRYGTFAPHFRIEVAEDARGRGARELWPEEALSFRYLMDNRKDIRVEQPQTRQVTFGGGPLAGRFVRIVATAEGDCHADEIPVFGMDDPK